MTRLTSLMAASAAALLAASVATAGAPPATTLDVLRAGTAHEAVYCIDVQGKEALAVGAPALLFESDDGGHGWRKVEHGLTASALLGCSLKQGVGLVVGQAGTILRREKEQTAWAAVVSGSTSRLFDIDLNASGQAVAVGAFGTVLRSGDGGKTWTQVAIDWANFNPEGLEPHLYGVTVDDGGAITVVGEFELILRSTDGGATWNAAHGGEASLFDLAIGRDGFGYAVGQKGTVLRTSDGGATWAAERTPTQVNLLGVKIRDDGAVLATGMRALLRGTKGRADWTVATPGDVATTWYQGVAAGSGGQWIVTGHRGRIVELTP